MKTIRWLVAGGALLAAAGVAILTSNAEAQVVRLFPGEARLLTQSEASVLWRALNGCWPHPANTWREARLERGQALEADRVYATISGAAKIDREEARRRFRVGEKIPRGLVEALPPVERCELTGQSLRAAESLTAALWPYAFDTWRFSTFRVDTARKAVLCTETRGAIGISEDSMLDLLESGEDAEIVGLVR